MKKISTDQSVLSFLLFFWLRCLTCKANLTSFPICKDCFSHLSRAPDLCSKCGQMDCVLNGPCLRLWQSDLSIHSYHSQYLLLGRSYQCLKEWKKSGGGFFLNSKIIRIDDEKIQNLMKLNLDWIIPIPQSFNRGMHLKHHPALLIASYLKQKLRVPIRMALKLNPNDSFDPQAKLDLEDRFKVHSRFSVNSIFEGEIRNKRVLLVDDFMTSGKTFLSAAKPLAEFQTEEIHCFSLGYRPQKRSGRQNL